MGGVRGRGEGEIFQKKFRDRHTKEIKTQTTWSIRYYDAHGKRHEQSSGSEERRDAVKLLNDKLHDARRGVPVGASVSRTKFSDLVRLIRNDYGINKRRSTRRLEQSLRHLEDAFGPDLATSITEERIDEYKNFRLAEDAENGTVNRELAALKRMFRLAQRVRKLGWIPTVTLLEEDNRRTGFFEPADFRAIREKLPADLRELADVAYITGWRVRSEILTLQWHQVDFGPQLWACSCPISLRDDECTFCHKTRPGWVHLYPEQSKNKQPRVFPMTPELRAALNALRRRTDLLEETAEYKGAGTDGEDLKMSWVFWRMRQVGVTKDGTPIRGWRRAWIRACVAAGFGEETREKTSRGRTRTKHIHASRIPHDFRRTAVRNLELAGVDRSTAMSMVGHRTESIYRRYAIVDATMMQRGASKLSKLHQEQTTTKDNVRQFKKAGDGKA